MSEFHIAIAKDGNRAHRIENARLQEVVGLDSVVVQVSGPLVTWRSPVGDAFFLVGVVHGIRQDGGRLQAVKELSPEILQKLESQFGSKEVEGRFVVICLSKAGDLSIWCDRFGRMDVYYTQSRLEVSIASDQEILTTRAATKVLDQINLAHSLTVYGGRPAKKGTWFSDVQRLGVGEQLHWRDNSLSVKVIDYVPVPISTDFSEKDLDEYSYLLLNAVGARASDSGNIVCLSSGWDSSAVLASLVHLYGPSHVRAVTGRMKYAERSGILNTFEIERAEKIAEFFGIQLEIIDYDYTNRGEELLREAKKQLGIHSFANFTGLNHWVLARAIAEIADRDQRIFTGEMSDAVHNLGFSQYVSEFHPTSFDYREYADKMMSYLFGPSFLDLLLNDRQDSCPVWRGIRVSESSTVFDEPGVDKLDRKMQLLTSFFLGGRRFPLASRRNKRLLTMNGQRVHEQSMQATYFSKVADTTSPETIYSAYMHLYPSFHWQGGTVQTREVTAFAHQLVLVNPFQDQALVDMLSRAPEDWGRGLELRPTKFPLKWMLQNKIRYPMHLQTGPHSYRYDIEPGFSIGGELLYGSSIRPLFLETLQSGAFTEKLDPEIFDFDYIGDLVRSYSGGNELGGDDLNNLISLAFHAVMLTDD